MGRVQHREFGFVFRSLSVGRVDKHVGGKRIVPSRFVNHTNGQTLRRLCTTKKVLHEQLVSRAEICQHLFFDLCEDVSADRLVHGTPPDFVLGRLGLDKKFIVRRTTGPLSSSGNKGPVCCQFSLAIANGFLDQLILF